MAHLFEIAGQVQELLVLWLVALMHADDALQ